MAFAAVKTPILVLATAALCLPGFYALHVVTGARRDFGAALRGVLAGQALFAIVLASLAPMLPVWYSAFGTSKRLAVLGAAGLFAIAGACSMIGVRRALAVCPRRGGRCWLLGAWFTLYAFVGMQMGWMLRPFIGSPELPPQMLREDALTNGYVVIFRLAFGD